MAVTQIRGENQILDATINVAKLETDFLGGLDWNITNGNNNATITGVKDPVNAQDVATKAFVEATAQGLKPQEAVKAATTANLVVTSTGAGVGAKLTSTTVGAFSVDGYSGVYLDRILVKNQVLQENNGIYVLTVVGDGGTAYELTRAADFDGSPSTEVVAGASVWVSNGLDNGATGWVLKTTGTIVVDTTPQVWTQFGGEGRYTAGDGIDIAANVISVDVTDIIDLNYGLVEDTNNIRVNLDAVGGLIFNAVSHGIEIKSDGVKASMIDFGTSTGQVSAADIPFSDPGNDYVATNVSAALQEVMDAVQAIDSTVSMDDAYNNGSTVNVDNTAVDFQLTDTKILKVTSDAGTTDVFKVTAASGGDKVDIIGELNQSGGAFTINGSAPSILETTAASLQIKTNTSGPLQLESAGILTFKDQYTSTGIALSQTGVSGLVGFTATSVVAALNELKSGSTSINHVWGELPTVTHNNPVVTLAHTPALGTARVFLNGVRQAVGAGNDYTISTATITFTFNLKTHDVVLVDYEY